MTKSRESARSDSVTGANDDLPGPAGERLGYSPFPVVGIGASAGGLEAFKQLLSLLPADTGMAFVLIQHLAPNSESRLTELLAKATQLPVVEAADQMPVAPDHVYVIPGNTTLTLEHGLLRVAPRVENRPHLPIDVFFRSLAEDSQARAIGVILSGSGADGTLGLGEIKAAGGTTFAQDERTAQHGGMPHSAIASGCADFVMAPAAIATELARVSRHPYLRAEAAHSADSPAQFKKILTLVRTATGVDFTHYRDTTIRRRIGRRMMLNTTQHTPEYVDYLERNPAEMDALYRDLLINVTSFFRDPELFEALKREVFPVICKGKPANTPVRFWVPGCSTGQEAYSLTIAWHEFLDDRPERRALQVFATDLSDPTSLDKARAGIYPESIEADVSPERLRRFFKKEDHAYRVTKSLRDACTFTRHDVAADPPFSHVDLVSCRNLLIYMAPALQKRVVPTFHYALNVPGFLVLGKSETATGFADLFDVVDRGNRIYGKKPIAARAYPHFRASQYAEFPVPPVAQFKYQAAATFDYQHEADRILLGRFVPPSVMVNESLDIVHYRGRTSAFLSMPPGEPTTNILKMAREGLFLDLRSALAEARHSHEPVLRRGLRVHGDDRVREVDLEVLKINPTGSSAGCFMVMFLEARPDPATARAATGAAPADAAADAATDATANARDANQLRQELTATKEYLQSLAEQQDAVNEELRTANEEILSSNEELQSTNEELETAKEELQSTNEELNTVNEQLQLRNAELGQVNNDLSNLLASTDIPVIMVGADQRVRSFTRPAKRLMNLLPTDIGRQIGDLRPAVGLPDLGPLIAEVVTTTQPLEREVGTANGEWYALRIHPYRTGDQRVDGAVIVLLDVTERKRAEQTLQEADHRKNEFMAMLAHELHNPLAPIRNALEIMRTAAGRAELVTEAHGVLDRQLGQLVRLVNDLLDVHRIAANKVLLYRERVELASIVRTAVETEQPFITARRHQLFVALPRQPVHLLADGSRLTQVLINLLHNAAKFTDEGGKVHVGAEVDRARNQVVITVRDTGIGIPAELLPRVFDMFAQGESSLEQGRGGLGIGLSLVRRLTEMHGGTVTASSEGPGRGSQFVVRLPIAADPPAPEKPALRQRPAGDGGACRILVVDDNRDQTMSLGRLLELWGHQVRTAHDGPGAVQAAKTFRPEVALVDLGLPGMDGWVVAQRLRELPELQGMLLIAQTGWAQEEDRQRSREAGFDHHLLKPLDLKLLRRLIAARLERGP